jgi:hypothetical protein
MSAGTALAVRTDDLDRLARLGKWLALAESKQTSPEARGASAALRFYYAEALGLPPMAAAELNVIDGKLVVSALLLRALAEERGYRVERDPSSDATSCTAVLYRESGRGNRGEIGRATFTIEQAKQAGLAGKTNWRTYPDRMLWARASTNVIRDYAPAVAVGIVTDEEMADRVDDPNVIEGVADEAPDVDWPMADQADPYDAERMAADEEAAERGEGGDPPDDEVDH